jgi:hypothetical protein
MSQEVILHVWNKILSKIVNFNQSETGQGIPELLDPPSFYPSIVRAQPFVVYQLKYDDGLLAVLVVGYLVPQ